jgi:hypothetical protein
MHGHHHWRRLRLGHPVATTRSRPAAGAGAGSSPDDEGRQPAGDAAAAATTARAKQELLQSWTLLKDAAAPFAPTTYSSLLQEAAAAEQPQQQLSLPDRLRRLLSGDFIRERVAAERGQQRQEQQQDEEVDPRLAAVQFELQQAPGYQQPPPVALEPPPAGPQQPGQQQQQQSSGAGPSSTPAGVRPAGAQPDAARPFYPASTQVLLFAMWSVFALQWAPVLPDLWAAVTSGSVWQPAAAVLLMFPDTPVTHGLCLVRVTY